MVRKSQPLDAFAAETLKIFIFSMRLNETTATTAITSILFFFLPCC
jgi:hypothetical protein